MIAIRLKLSFLTVLLAGGLSLPAFAQNVLTDTLVWQADQSINVQNNDTLVYAAQFKTFGSGTVEWIQARGQRTSTYIISESEGTWTDVTQNGSVTFSLTRSERQSTMKLERNSSGLFITMDFMVTGQSPIRQIFRIQSVQTLD